MLFTGLSSCADCHSPDNGNSTGKQTSEKETEPPRTSYFAQDYTSAKWQGCGLNKFNQI